MIIYSDGPSISFVNSILEKDIIKRIPSDYSLNILISSETKSETNNKMKSNNKSIIVNNIQRDLINLLNYENEQSFIFDKNDKENNNLNQEYVNDNNQNSESISKNEEIIQLMNKNSIEEKGATNNNQIIMENQKDFNNNSRQNNQDNDINDINNKRKNKNGKENLEYNFNQNIYNNFNIPYVNFIYNIGTNGMNNNYMNNNINNPININNYNNNYINSNKSMNPNMENYSNNINDYYNNNHSFNNNYVSNNYKFSNQDYDSLNNNNFNNYFGQDNNNRNINNKRKNSQKETNYMNMSLKEITNKLEQLATKKHGCKFLENFLKISKNRSEIVNKEFYPKLYWIKLYELSNDLFGNYFIQTLIPELDNNNLMSFTNIIIGNLLNLCLNPHGTRVVQILINNIKDNKCNLLLTFTNALSKIMDKLINNLNGSFVLMHYAATIKDNEIIYDFLNNNLIEIATNSYSCSALQKLIDIGTNKQKQKLLINIINNTDKLVGNQCGLYVLQFIMNKNNYYINDTILDKIFNRIIYLSKRKYSSNVIEKCFETCSPERINQLINIFNNEVIIRDLIKDIFGNYVIQKLLIVCPNEEIRKQILGYIALEYNNLKNLSFGQKLMNKLIISYPQIRKYL